MLAQSPRHDYAKALKMHQQSIQLALPLATHQRSDVRQAARHQLIDAHLAIASDVAQGTWQKKAAIVPQWLDRAGALAEDYVKHEQGDTSIQLEILCRRLDAYAWLDGKLDPTETLRKARIQAANLRMSNDDPTFGRHVDWLPP